MTYKCTCGKQYYKWQGKCDSCQKWNEISEHVQVKKTYTIPKVSPKKATEKRVSDNQRRNDDRNFYVSIWKERPHECGNCKTPLHGEPLLYYFDHILEKSKYKHLRYEKDNIWFLCGDCHSAKTNGHYSEIMKQKINHTKKLFQCE